MDVYHCPLCTECVLRLFGAWDRVRVSLEGANFRELRKGEVRRIPLPRTWVNKGKGEGPGPVGPQPCLLPDSCSVVEEGVYSPQTAVVVTFLQVPGVPLSVH